MKGIASSIKRPFLSGLFGCQKPARRLKEGLCMPEGQQGGGQCILYWHNLGAATENALFHVPGDFIRGEQDWEKCLPQRSSNQGRLIQAGAVFQMGMMPPITAVEVKRQLTVFVHGVANLTCKPEWSGGRKQNRIGMAGS